jgi:predicted RND superfamily exporter protein
MTDSFIRFLLRYRWPVLILIFISLLGGGYFITTIKVDNDTFKAVPPNIKPRLDYDKLKKEFPAPFNILFLAQFESGTLTEKIDSLRSWSRQFRALPGITGVTDLTTIVVPVKQGFLGLSGNPVIPSDSTIDEARTRTLIAANPEFCRLFISTDENTLGMIVALDWTANRTLILDTLLSKVKSINRTPHLTVYITSEGAVSYFIDKSMHRDFRLLLPFCFLLVFILLYRVFRNMLHVAASVGAVAAALIWTFGLMGLLGIPFNIVTSIIPVIIFPIGVADAIHLIRTYRFGRSPTGATLQSALTATYRELMLPCLLTSLTTFAGFASFVLSSISWNRTFGIFTGIAVLFCYLFNILLLPLVLSFEKRDRAPVAAASAEERALNRFWDGFIQFTLASKRWIVILPVLAVLLVVGIRSTRVENNFMMMLPAKNQLRQSDDFIARHFGGTRFFSIVLEKKDSTITTADEWRRIDTFTSFVKQQEGVGNVTSLMPLINRVSSMLSGKEISPAAVALITAPGGFSGKSYGRFIGNFLSADRSRTRIQVTCRNERSVKTLDIARNIEGYAREHLPGYSVLVSGPAILSESMSAVLVNTLIVSLIATVIPVFLCLVFFFRSLRIGIYCIVPIFMLLVFVYAMMGLCGVSINLITVVIMNTCIGIGIDYAIHFISGYIHTLKTASTTGYQALAITIRQKGTPIFFNTLVVGVGFCVLLFSSFPPIRDFGLLVFISMFVAAGFCIFIISLIIAKFGLTVPSLRKETS